MGPYDNIYYSGDFILDNLLKVWLQNSQPIVHVLFQYQTSYLGLGQYFYCFICLGYTLLTFSCNETNKCFLEVAKSYEVYILNSTYILHNILITLVFSTRILGVVCTMRELGNLRWSVNPTQGYISSSPGWTDLFWFCDKIMRSWVLFNFIFNNILSKILYNSGFCCSTQTHFIII